MTEKKEYWECELDTVKECSKAPQFMTVYIHDKAKSRFDVLMNKYKRMEWLAYLIGAPGNIDGIDHFVVSNIFIPDQIVSPSNILKVTCPEFNKLRVIGVLHSHHGMGTTFSQMDHDFINENHNISLVITHGKIRGQYRWKTPCGAFKTIPARVRPMYDIKFDTKDFLKEIDKKIEIFTGEEKKVAVVVKNSHTVITEDLSGDDDNQDLISAMDEVYKNEDWKVE